MQQLRQHARCRRPATRCRHSASPLPSLSPEIYPDYLSFFKVILSELFINSDIGK